MSFQFKKLLFIIHIGTIYRHLSNNTINLMVIRYEKNHAQKRCDVVLLINYLKSF